MRSTYNGLGVAILSTHGEIQTKGVAVDNIDVAGLRSAQGVNPSAERLIGINVHHNSSVFAMNADIIACA